MVISGARYDEEMSMIYQKYYYLHDFVGCYTISQS